jgi:hypothetical protein
MQRDRPKRSRFSEEHVSVAQKGALPLPSGARRSPDAAGLSLPKASAPTYVAGKLPRIVYSATFGLITASLREVGRRGERHAGPAAFNERTSADQLVGRVSAAEALLWPRFDRPSYVRRAFATPGAVHVHVWSCQGSTRSTPIAAKSLMLRVASAQPFACAMAAIKASGSAIGRPARRALARIRP